MNPSQNPVPSFEAPMPPSQGKKSETSSLPEVAPQPLAAPMAAPSPASSKPLPPVAATIPAPAAPAQAAPQTTSSSPAVADDLDLIEKEWVEKAKEIVHKTRTDPHAQNKEMNRFKADYMKKRYNKDLKLSE